MDGRNRRGRKEKGKLVSRKINVETVEAVEADFEKEKGKLVPGKI